MSEGEEVEVMTEGGVGQKGRDVGLLCNGREEAPNI